MAKDTKAQVEELAVKLERELGDNLVAFALYGPAVRRDTPEKERELTTLLIARDVSPKALRPIEATIGQWTKKGHPPPLVFSERGWRASADVFPIEIEDMREAHLLIRGDSPFENVATDRGHLRHELEREVRGKLLRLRTEFVATAADGKALERLLLDSAGTFFILFRAVLRLVGETPPQEPEPLVRATAEAATLDAGAFEWILQRFTGRKPPGLKAYDPVGDRYMEQIERLAHFIDTYDPTGGGGEAQESQ
ncbi:MAG: hypothetical protein GWN51_14605 [Gemmatimonadetes bacterium]|nr:hypothetical protein [Gemmatimonadota bacterium]NIV24862.1 hypothetical protein [Gemmatimonadota bacterium]NIW76824.1 hypothetical protein [Gemmatimonadota bacterium]